MDIFSLHILLIVSLSVFRLSDARARVRRTGTHSVYLHLHLHLCI